MEGLFSILGLTLLVKVFATLSSEIGLQLEINCLPLFSFLISLIMVSLWDVLRAFKHFDSLKRIYENIFNFLAEKAVALLH